ncbi:MAG: hypothetical protein AB1725_05145 [Armatimonadota bacterium]
MLTTILAAAATVTLAGAPAPQLEQYEANLIPVGTKVPDFELQTPNGAKLKLLETLKKSKVTVINFWFYN